MNTPLPKMPISAAVVCGGLTTNYHRRHYPFVSYRIAGILLATLVAVVPNPMFSYLIGCPSDVESHV